MYTCPETDIYSRLTHGLTEATHTILKEAAHTPHPAQDCGRTLLRSGRQSPQPQGSVRTLQGGEVEHEPVKDTDMGLIS